MIVGKIVSVNFNQFKAKVRSEIRGNSVNVAGQVYYFGNIGSYLKTRNSVGEELICEVTSIFDGDPSSTHDSYDIEGEREIILRPIGTINRDKVFSLGVGIFPSIYSEVSIVSFDDMEHILKTKTDSEPDDKIHQSFFLGTSKNLINYPIDININAFFNIHSAVLGNSGSGKSNTIAHILQEIFRKENHTATGSRILIFDVNGEYKNAFSEANAKESLNISFLKPNSITGRKEDEFLLPHFLLNIDEWSDFLMATDATQRPFWDKVLQECYKFYMIATHEGEERKKFINYIRYKICSLIESLMAHADSDTATVTTARNILYSMNSIIENDVSLNDACQNEGLKSDILELHSSCKIEYGDNKERLKKAVAKIENKIDSELSREVLALRAKGEEYFDYRFLKQAANIVLLEEDARGNGRIREYTSTMMTRLDYFLDNPDCEFMRNTPPNVKNAEDYLEWIWEHESKGKAKTPQKTNLVIIDTSELSRDALETLTAVVSRINFSARKSLYGKERTKNPIHLILDEAHRYIKKDTKYLLRENIFEKIAREGRKYSIYLLVSSQRPSELSETVLSQCSNFIIHRIQNELDMRYVYAILPYFTDDFSHKIKQSTPGEALIFGNCVSMPLHLSIQQAAPEPSSENCEIHKQWFRSDA